MRASRETELGQSFPLHVVTAWIGNTARIAAKHYLQVTDEDFAKALEQKELGAPAVAHSDQGGAQAAHKAAQSEAGNGCQEGTIVPASEQKGRENTSRHEKTLSDRFVEYARQESNL